MGYDEAGSILKQAVQLGINATFFGADTITSKAFQANAAGAAEGMYFTFWDSDRAEVVALKQEYLKKYGEVPENILFTVMGYDAMMALADRMQGGFRGESLKENLYTLDRQGLAGRQKMDSDGMVRTVQEMIFQLQEGQEVLVEL